MLGKKHGNSAPKVLEVDASFQGNLIFKDEVNLKINGHFEGRLETKGDLLIGEQASVKANILGDRVAVAGSVTGDVTAKTELRLLPTSRIVGDVKTPNLIIERGAVLHGSSFMLVNTD